MNRFVFKSSIINLKNPILTQFKSFNSSSKLIYNQNKFLDINKKYVDCLKLNNFKYFSTRSATNRIKFQLNSKFNLYKNNKNFEINNQLKRLNANDSSNAADSNSLKSQPIVEQKSPSIFTRFKEAYKQHGKILILCHVITSCGWITGFFFLSKGGYDITSLFKIFEKLHIMSNETSINITNKINDFNLENFLKKSFFHYILPDSLIKSIGELITGVTLKHMITAVMLYKIFAPLRYVVTLAVTNIVIKVFKKQGKIPMHPPPGSSIKELYTEQQLVLRRSLKKQREKYKNRRLLLRANQTPKQNNQIFTDPNKRKNI